MRIVSVIFYILGGIGLILWAVGYMFVVSMACAFSGPAGRSPCTTPLPWELNSDDFQAMVMTPALLIIVVFGVAVLCGRAARKRADP